HPLVILSHGYPGNRMLLAHFGEHLATRGYAVASLDHPQSTYADQAAFGATLYHRPRDQAFALAALAGDPRVDAARAAVIGYSMGGYGALVFGGAGVTAAALALPGAPPHGLWAEHLAGSAAHGALMDPRLACIIAIGPWTGQGTGLDPAGLRVPAFIMAGSRDAVTGYAAMRAFWAAARGTARHLLTFVNAGHNAAAPFPAPAEGWAHDDRLGFAPHAHYADPVWDTLRMNNIAQHYAAAFLDRHLRGNAGADWLGPAEPDEDRRGFAPGTTAGIGLELRGPGD
ncbi:MAG: alpha/beta hydrolase family protein, partial [Gemmobacter sp.]